MNNFTFFLLCKYGGKWWHRIHISLVRAILLANFTLYMLKEPITALVTCQVRNAFSIQHQMSYQVREELKSAHLVCTHRCAHPGLPIS